MVVVVVVVAAGMREPARRLGRGRALLEAPAGRAPRRRDPISAMGVVSAKTCPSNATVLRFALPTYSSPLPSGTRPPNAHRPLSLPPVFLLETFLPHHRFSSSTTLIPHSHTVVYFTAYHSELPLPLVDVLILTLHTAARFLITTSTLPSPPKPRRLPP